MWKSEATAPRDGPIIARVTATHACGVGQTSSRSVVWNDEQSRWQCLWYPQDEIMLHSWRCRVPSIEADDIAQA